MSVGGVGPGREVELSGGIRQGKLSKVDAKTISAAHMPLTAPTSSGKKLAGRVAVGFALGVGKIAKFVLGGALRLIGLLLHGIAQAVSLSGRVLHQKSLPKK